MSKFGRVPSPIDERDWDVKTLEAMVLAGTAIPVAWETPVVFDQGPDECVGYSIATLCASASSVSSADATVDAKLGERIYKRAKEIDGMPNIAGTYMRAGLKAAQEYGLLDNYAHTDFSGGNGWVRSRGPALLGIPWFESMMKTDTSGVIGIKGSVKGGHAICWTMDAQTPADNGLVNSWGYRWGRNGRCYISDADLYYLVDMNGEVWTAVKVLEPARHWPDLPAMDYDDLLSQDACYKQGILKGYPDGTFKPGETVTVHQVGTVMVRMGLKKKNPWDHPKDYVMPALRGWVHEELPMLEMHDLDRPLEPVSRFALMLMVGRYLRRGGVK